MLHKSQKGILLVEAAIIVFVLAVLVGIMAPEINSFVDRAKDIKVRGDVRVLGLAITRLIFDTGSSCIKKRGSDVCRADNQVALLYGDGPDVDYRDVSNSSVDTRFYPCSENIQTNWYDDNSSSASSMSDQLVTNVPGYPRTNNKANLLGAGSGWRGAYISDGVSADPWGHRYLANVMFLASPVDQIGPCEGQRGGPRWSKDTFVISAGPNGIFETPFSVDGASSAGDDTIFIVAGNGT